MVHVLDRVGIAAEMAAKGAASSMQGKELGVALSRYHIFFFFFLHFVEQISFLYLEVK